MSEPRNPVCEYRLRRRVQFHETDAAGIVHFSRYILYMEEAEHALWREAGLSIAPRDSLIGWPRTAVSFEYHRALHFEEEVDVHLRIVEIGERTIRYACELRRGDERVATGSMTIVCVTKKPGDRMRSVPIPADVAARLAVAPEAVE
jgi:4-hydroxybenzoyl-CoA thioesterase/acyl-CoA thioester hydrolase